MLFEKLRKFRAKFSNETVLFYVERGFGELKKHGVSKMNGKLTDLGKIFGFVLLVGALFSNVSAQYQSYKLSLKPSKLDEGLST